MVVLRRQYVIAASHGLPSIREAKEPACGHERSSNEKNLFAFAMLSAVAATSRVACGNDDPAPTFTVKVIGFNDYHGNLESPRTFGQSTTVPTASRPPVGGVEFLASHVAHRKKQNPLDVVVGPVNGAGNFHAFSPTACPCRRGAQATGFVIVHLQLPEP